MSMVLGVDIGGTTIKGGVFEKRTLVKSFSVPTCGSAGRETILSNLYKLIDTLIVPEINFIGIASAGNINNATGEVVYATDNLKGWTGLRLADTISKKYDRECKVENDAIAAMLAEVSVLGQKYNKVVMLTFGTGVGGAWLENGKVIRGANFDGGRWGHMCLERGGRKCNCGSLGCAEQYLSATALFKDAAAIDPAIENTKQLFEKFRQKEKNAITIIDTYAKNLNKFLNMINRQISPEIIIMGGGLLNAKDIFETIIDPQIKNIVYAKLGNNAGIYGAAFAL